jgi:hypothetical protein
MTANYYINNPNTRQNKLCNSKIKWSNLLAICSIILSKLDPLDPLDPPDLSDLSDLLETATPMIILATARNTSG